MQPAHARPNAPSMRRQSVTDALSGCQPPSRKAPSATNAFVLKGSALPRSQQPHAFRAQAQTCTRRRLRIVTKLLQCSAAAGAT
eukprot:5085309-Alexandrium_andersonii.AAC.1